MHSSFLNIRLFLLVALSLLALTFGGCGGSDNGDSGAATTATPTVDSEAKPLTKAEFIKRASEFCEAAAERSSAEFGRYVKENAIPPSGPGMIAKAADAVETVFVPAYEKLIETISELGAPKGDEERINAILAAMQEGVYRAKQHPLQYIRHATAFNHASKLAIEYGLPACSNGNV